MGKTSDVGVALNPCFALGLRWIWKCNTMPRVVKIDFVERVDGPMVGCECSVKGGPRPD